jgi:AraC-like DNA-binding protein
MVDLAGLWGKAGEQLRLRLSSSENAEEMIGLLASALNPAAETSAQSMVLHVVAHGGRLPLADLARFAGLSQRQLRRVFLENTGLAPKVFCRVLRFRGLVEHVVSNVASSGEERWAELALDHGYYDQSHLTNEFRELSGLTPSEYKARL